MTQAGNQAGVLASRAAPWARGAGWIMEGIRAFTADWFPWLVISLLMLAGSLFLQVGLPVLGTLLVFLLSPVVVAGLMLAMAERQGGRPLLVRDMWRALAGPNLGALLAVGAVSLLLNIAALTVMLVFVDRIAGIQTLTSLAQSEDMLRKAADLTYALGLLTGVLVYVALLMPITMLVWFAPALVVLEGEGALAAMKHSFIGCVRNFMPFLLYGLVGLLLLPLLMVLPAAVILLAGTQDLMPMIIALAVTSIAGFAVTVPVGLASIFVAYRDIFHRT